MRDRTPFARHATINGALGWTGSESGVAFNFAGSSASFASAGTLGGDAFDVPFAASAWVYNITTAGQPDAGIVSKADVTPAGNTNYNGWLMWLNGGKCSAFWLNATRVTGATTVSSVRRWQHLLIQWTGSAAEVYVNGRLDGSSATTTAPSAAAANLEVGRYRAQTGGGTLDRGISGLVDDVRVYRRSLTRGEVALLASQRGIGLLPTRNRRGKVLGSQFWLRQSGEWKKATTWINVGGTWKQTTPKLKVGGTWQ